MPGGRLHSARSGLTFIEVMVTAVILSAGLVAIYRSFIIGADLSGYLAERLYALNLLETRSALMERDLQALKPPDIGPMQQEVVVGGRPVVFQFSAELKPVGELLSIFEFDLMVSWQSRGRTFSLLRTAYFSGLSSLASVEGAL